MLCAVCDLSAKEQHMHNPMSELYDELIEERLLQVLSRNNVLPYADLKTRTAADDRAWPGAAQGRSQRPVVSRVREGAAGGLRGKPG
jgi:hypothetical protein